MCHNLGIKEENKVNMDRAVRHYMIAVGSGYNRSLKKIQELYSNGHATKEDYTTALQLYQEYLGEIKRKQRDEAAAARENFVIIRIGRKRIRQKSAAEDYPKIICCISDVSSYHHEGLLRLDMDQIKV